MLLAVRMRAVSASRGGVGDHDNKNSVNVCKKRKLMNSKLEFLFVFCFVLFPFIFFILLITSLFILNPKHEVLLDFCNHFQIRNDYSIARKL